ncbi:MAG: bifunctional folylpolyglutamate synthase/dihydrofolate synthase [Victivallaceae bacterium]|nr:bifunctional folylpolyglutamate synthase/dihydrofolate synthase [Victivallaceae bacterium]
MNYQQAVAYLGQLEKFGVKLGLEQTAELFRRADSPERQLKFIHLAGTNGKGSCAAMLESALRHCGFKTGLYTSPHLISPCERIRINGCAVSETEYAAAVSRLKLEAEAMNEAGKYPTYFEFTTVMAAQIFAAAQVDFVIWETGMGGRFDSTNVVEPICCAITGIALDHQKYLGTDIATIAKEKAGIIKAGKPVFCGKMPAEAAAVVTAVATRLAAPLKWCEGDISEIKFELKGDTFKQSFSYQDHQIHLGLPGIMQRCNFKVVFEILKYLSAKFNFRLETALDGLRRTRWPARLQFFPDGSVLDGAHNPDGAAALVESLNEILPFEKFSVIMANFTDKDTVGVMRQLDRIAAEFIFVPLHVGDRNGYTPESLLKMLHEFSDTPARTVLSLQEALTVPCLKRKLIAGSLFLAGETLPSFYPAEQILNLN